eukprot:s153_g14.t1
MAISISLFIQSERRCKFIKRLEVEQTECGNTCGSIKAFTATWMEQNTGERSVVEKELKVKIDDAEIGEGAVVPSGAHIQVIYTSLTVQLAMACNAFAKTDAGKKANEEFQKLFVKKDTETKDFSVLDTDAQTTTADVATSSDAQASTYDVLTDVKKTKKSVFADDDDGEASPVVEKDTATSHQGTDEFVLPNALNDKKAMMAELQNANAEMEAKMKDNKKKIQRLRDAIRSSSIKVWLVRPSGEKFDITTQPDFTVSKLKKSIDNVYGFASCFQRLVANDASGAPVEMKNAKKLFSYNILSDGDEICFVMTGGKHVPTPAIAEGEGYDASQPPVVQQSSDEEEDEEEDITETPPMSDDDVPQEPVPRPWNMRIATVKDFTNKHVRFYGKIDQTMTLDIFMGYILTFEDLTEEQVEMLQFTDDRGNPYASGLTVQQCMDMATFTCFYIKVKGLMGGVNSQKRVKKLDGKTKVFKENAMKVSSAALKAEVKDMPKVKKAEVKFAEFTALLTQSMPMDAFDALLFKLSEMELAQVLFNCGSQDFSTNHEKMKAIGASLYGAEVKDLKKTVEDIGVVLEASEQSFFWGYNLGMSLDNRFNIGVLKLMAKTYYDRKVGVRLESERVSNASASRAEEQSTAVDDVANAMSGMKM